jgi:hypothetical protein
MPLFGHKSPKPTKQPAVAVPATPPPVPPLPNLQLALIDDTCKSSGRGGGLSIHGFDLEYPNGKGLPLNADGPVDERVYYFRVAGVAHHEATAQSDSFTPLSQVYLVREPTNAYDPNAIQVLSQTRENVGYVPRGAAAQMAALMKRVGTTVVAATVTKTFNAHGKRTAIEVLAGVNRNIELVGTVNVDDDAQLSSDDQWKLKAQQEEEPS